MDKISERFLNNVCQGQSGRVCGDGECSVIPADRRASRIPKGMLPGFREDGF